MLRPVVRDSCRAKRGPFIDYVERSGRETCAASCLGFPVSFGAFSNFHHQHTFLFDSFRRLSAPQSLDCIYIGHVFSGYAFQRDYAYVECSSKQLCRDMILRCWGGHILWSNVVRCVDIFIYVCVSLSASNAPNDEMNCL